MTFSLTNFVRSVVCTVVGAMSLAAAPITINFATGGNVFSAWPGNTGAANLNGVALTSPLLLHTGELRITATGGSLVCAQSASNASLCGATGAFGLGVSSGGADPAARIDPGQFLTLTLTNLGFTTKLVSFDVTGLGTSEIGYYRINGGAQNTFSGPLTTVTAPGAGTNFTSVEFGIATGNTGNYTLGSLTLDVTPAPEPATCGLMGLAMLGLGMVGRRKRA